MAVLISSYWGWCFELRLFFWCLRAFVCFLFFRRLYYFTFGVLRLLEFYGLDGFGFRRCVVEGCRSFGSALVWRSCIFNSCGFDWLLLSVKGALIHCCAT